MIFMFKKIHSLKKYAFFFVVVLIVLFNIQNSKAQMLAPPNNVPPSHCRIIGEVVDIFPVKAQKGAKNPCEKYPCQAKVKVLKTLGRGSGFNVPLSKDKIILVKFAFTLEPTQKLFPQLNKALPGLKTGEKFQADVQGLDGLGEQAVNFTIFTYRKQ